MVFASGSAAAPIAAKKWAAAAIAGAAAAVLPVPGAVAKTAARFWIRIYQIAAAAGKTVAAKIRKNDLYRFCFP